MSGGVASTASRSVKARLSVTASAASALFRCRASAIDRAYAAMSAVLFCAITSPPADSPPAGTGCAAPMCVPGDIAATSAAIVIRKPAEAARAPDGEMNTTIGARAAIMRDTIVRVDSTRPPGVRNTSTVAAAPAPSARAMTSSMNSAAMGWMMPSYSATTTRGGSSCAGSVASSGLSSQTPDATAASAAARRHAEAGRRRTRAACRIRPS